MTIPRRVYRLLRHRPTIAEDAAGSRHEIELTLNGALAEDDITVAFTITGSATSEWY